MKKLTLIIAMDTVTEYLNSYLVHDEGLYSYKIKIEDLNSAINIKGDLYDIETGEVDYDTKPLIIEWHGKTRLDIEKELCNWLIDDSCCYDPKHNHNSYYELNENGTY